MNEVSVHDEPVTILAGNVLMLPHMNVSPVTVRISQHELERLPRYISQMLDAGIMNFFYNLPEDIQRLVAIDSSLTADYWGSAIKIGDMFLIITRFERWLI